jgi:ABC-type sugar transport system, periplasmic component
MIRVKKLTSLVIVAGFVIMLLNGCGSAANEKKTTDASSTTASVTQAASTAADEPVTLRWVNVGPGKQKDADEVWAEFNNKLKEYLPNTTVEFDIIQPSDFKQKWDLMMAANEEADIGWTGWMQDYPTEIRKGSFLPLDELIDKYAPDLKKELPEYLFGLASYEGKIYSIPCYQMQAGGRGGIYMPKDLFEKYFDFEKWKKINNDWKTQPYVSYDLLSDDFYNVIEDYLKKCKDAGQLRSGFSPFYFDGVLLHGMDICGSGMPTIFRIPNRGQAWDLTVQNCYALPEQKKFYEKMADWYKKGYLRKDLLTDQNYTQYENNDKNDGDVIWYNSYMPVDNPNADYIEVKNWKNPTVQVPMQTEYVTYVFVNNTAVVIPRTCKYPEKAIKIIDLMNTKKGKDIYNLLIWGIDGKHYNKVSDNRIETVGYSGQGATDSAYGLWKWATGNTFNAYYEQTTKDGYNEFILNEVNGKALTTPVAGLKPDTSAISSELAQCKTVVDEYDKMLQCGGLADNPKAYDEFLSKLKAAGVDKIITEMQKQVDEFLKNKGIFGQQIIAK